MDLARGMSGALVAYNAALNASPTDGPSYVPVNVAVAAAAVAAGRASGLGWEEMGLVPRARGVKAGLAMSGIAGAMLAGSFLHPWTRDLLGDERASGITGRDLAFRTLVRIPIGTALVEEVLFRGVLQAAWQRRRPGLPGLAAASAAFGLWHIGPGLQAMRMNRVRGWTALGGVAGMVAGTAAGGAFLSALRIRTSGIVAPAVVHAAVNSMTMVAAVVALRTRHRWGPPARPLRGRGLA